MSYVGEIKDGVLKRYVDAPGAKLKISTKATVIGPSAFKGKNSLREVVLHDSVTEIGSNAFSGCENLTKINFPEGLREIGEQAFMGCKNIREVQLPSTLEKIGGFAFSDTAWLKEADENLYAAGFLLRAFLQDGEFEIAPGTRGVVGGAFEGCANLNKLTIPEGVTFLGDGIFRSRYGNGPEWDKLEEIVIPDSVTYIGAEAFSGCTALCRIIISEETVKRLGQRMIERAFFGVSVMDYRRAAEAYRKSLPLRALQGDPIELSALREPLDVFLRKKDTRAELFPFLIENDMPHSLTAALKAQKKLPLDELETYLDLAEKKQSVELKAILMDYQNSKFTVKEKEKKAREDDEKALGMKELSLADWRKIFKVAVKDGKATISGYVGNEPEATIPETIGKYIVTEIKERAFSGNKTLNHLDIQAKLKTIPQKAFERSALVSLKMPDSVKSIGSEAFVGCTNLETIHLSKKLQTIGFAAFRHCSNLQSLSLPNGLKTIHSWAFAYCGALKRVDLPDTVVEMTVGNEFFFCENLTIHAPAGSYAEQYAKENNIPFVAE